MRRKPHKGPVLFSAVFILAAVAMPTIGELPMHLALAAKVLMLFYAAGLLALSFIPVKEDKPRTGTGTVPAPPAGSKVAA